MHDGDRQVPFIPPDDGSGRAVAELLAASRRGDPTALDRLLPLLYSELHQIAERHMCRERPDHTLQPTALVHEAFLRLADSAVGYNDRAHFMRAASRAMRHVLVDYARARNAAKRGDGVRVTLDEGLAAPDDRVVDLLVLDDALDRLAEAEPRWARVVELRCFGGLEMLEIAAALEISAATAKRDWQFARAWLANVLRGGTPSFES